MWVRPRNAFTRSITAGEISILCMVTSSMRERPLTGSRYGGEKQQSSELLPGGFAA
jgi:hypothetical protein